MTYNSDQVYERIIDPEHLAKKAQVGVDLTLGKVEKISGIGVFEGDSKLNRDLVHYEEAPRLKDILDKIDPSIREMLKGIDLNSHLDDYYLEPNSHFVIEFQQGVNIGNKEWAFMYHRSSFNRAGSCFLNSCVWDPNFSTNIMGTSFHTGSIPIILPIGTRIAQMLMFECTEVPEDKLYNGQWQGVANH